MSASSDTPVIAAATVGETVTQATETTATEQTTEATTGTGESGTTATEGKTTETATEAKTGEQTETAKPRKDGISGRMSELTAARRAAETARQEADTRADTLAKSLETAIETIKTLGATKTSTDDLATQAQKDPRPDRSKFDEPNAYDDALIEWSARQATRVATAEIERKQAEAAEATKAKTEQERAEADKKAAFDAFNVRVSTFQQRQEKALEQFPDYQEKVLDNDEVQITVAMREAILDADNGPAIAYHLANNIPESERISKLNPVAQVFEMGRISAELARPKSNVSKAPPPITATGSRQSAAERSRDEMTGDEYYAVRNAELRAARH